MKKLILILFLGLFSVGAYAAEAPAVRPTALTAQDHTDLARIEAYLNNLKNISADFMQVDDAGGILHGQIAISRPGKMRVNYSAPNKDFIIADGSFVHIWNDDLKAQTNVEQNSSLAEFILRDPIKLNGDVTLTKIERFPAKIEITLVDNKDPASGSLILVFEDRPLKLRQWKVVDAEGHTTGVNLENMSENVTFPANTFFFVPPSFSKS
jgi:outer membrane lipoprotein-sorting protein